MLVKEKWLKWEPIAGLSPKYYIRRIVDDGIFEITLDDEDATKKSVRVLFYNGIDCYRKTNEGFRLKTLGELDEYYDLVQYAEWTFFKVTNSEYRLWLDDQSQGISEGIKFAQFSFVDDECFFDVICGYEPKVEFIDRHERKMD